MDKKNKIRKLAMICVAAIFATIFVVGVGIFAEVSNVPNIAQTLNGNENPEIADLAEQRALEQGYGHKVPVKVGGKTYAYNDVGGITYAIGQLAIATNNEAVIASAANISSCHLLVMNGKWFTNISTSSNAEFYAAFPGHSVSDYNSAVKKAKNKINEIFAQICAERGLDERGYPKSASTPKPTTAPAPTPKPSAANPPAAPSAPAPKATPQPSATPKPTESPKATPAPMESARPSVSERPNSTQKQVAASTEEGPNNSATGQTPNEKPVDNSAVALVVGKDRISYYDDAILNEAAQKVHSAGFGKNVPVTINGRTYSEEDKAGIANAIIALANETGNKDAISAANSIGDHLLLMNGQWYTDIDSEAFHNAFPGHNYEAYEEALVAAQEKIDEEYINLCEEKGVAVDKRIRAKKDKQNSAPATALKPSEPQTSGDTSADNAPPAPEKEVSPIVQFFIDVWNWIVSLFS